MPKSEKFHYVVGRLTRAVNRGQPIVFDSGFGDGEIVDESDNDVIRVHKLVALHGPMGARQFELPFHEESHGTRRLLSLLLALYRLTKEGGVFVIDELERSMHPMLARKFIEFFLKAGRTETAS